MTLFSLYEQKLIRLTDNQGNTFTGVADTFPAEYGLHEYGREEEGIQLGEYVIYRSQILTGCLQKLDGDGMERSFNQISQETAKEMMARDDGHVVVDVRRQDEYDEGHIPGAILIPNESIGTEKPEALPDMEQIILIYCRSGNRSKQAAQKLFDMGYTNIYEFGGINTWSGEIVTE